MRRASKYPLAVILATLLTLALNGAATPMAPADEPGFPESSTLRKAAIPWDAKMQDLYKTLAAILTDVSSDRRFNNPANRQRIDNEARNLSSLAHDLGKRSMIRLDRDPSVPMIAALLARESKLAVTELQRGHRQYARSLLRSIPGYCIACHTRNSSGARFAELPLEPRSGSLTPLERGEFFTASRQFDRGQKEFMEVIQHPKGKDGAYGLDWERAIQEDLAIAVRVKQNPAQAEEVVQAVLDAKGAPSFVQEDAKAWKASIENWKAEVPRRAVSEEGLYAEAMRLMKDARDLQKYPMDQNADILFLRASAAAHDLLQTAPKGRHLAEALLLAGTSYEILNPLKTEDLHDFYYEACIFQAPHTETAQICYKRYEQSMIFGFTGSAGRNVPEEVLENLLELRALSEPSRQVKP